MKEYTSLLDWLKDKPKLPGNVSLRKAHHILEKLKKDHFIKDDPDYVPQLAGSKKKQVRNWSAFNQARTNENITTLTYILNEILDYIPFPKNKKRVGRPKATLREQIYCAAIQQFIGKGSRQTEAQFKDCKKMGHIHKVPSFNTVLRYLRNPQLEPYLKHLVNVSGLPLAQTETIFATDGTGMGLKSYERWFDVRLGEPSKKRSWRKLHVTCGIYTHIISSVTTTDGRAHDSPQLPEHIKVTQKVYKNLQQWLADKAYCNRKNFNLIYEAGALPFIPFTKRTKHDTKKGASMIWKRMAYLSEFFPEMYAQNKNQRAQIECVMNMLKTRLRSSLRSKMVQSQTNEILAKCVVHNLTVLLHEAYRLNLVLDFKKIPTINLLHQN